MSASEKFVVASSMFKRRGKTSPTCRGCYKDVDEVVMLEEPYVPGCTRVGLREFPICAQCLRLALALLEGT